MWFKQVGVVSLPGCLFPPLYVSTKKGIARSVNSDGIYASVPPCTRCVWDGAVSSVLARRSTINPEVSDTSMTSQGQELHLLSLSVHTINIIQDNFKIVEEKYPKRSYKKRLTWHYKIPPIDFALELCGP